MFIPKKDQQKKKEIVNISVPMSNYQDFQMFEEERSEFWRICIIELIKINSPNSRHTIEELSEQADYLLKEFDKRFNKLQND